MTSLKDKAAVKKMSATNTRSLNRMKLQIKKHNKNYEDDITKCRENPAEYEADALDEESDDESDSESDSDSDSDGSSSSSSSSSSDSGSDSDSDESDSSSGKKPTKVSVRRQQQTALRLRWEKVMMVEKEARGGCRCTRTSGVQRSH